MRHNTAIDISSAVKVRYGAYLCPLPLLAVAVQRLHREAAVPRLLRDPVAHSLFRREYDLKRVKTADTLSPQMKQPAIFSIGTAAEEVCRDGK